MEYGFFFFSSRRRHTRFDCDWSSDVCSSDLALSLTADQAMAPPVPVFVICRVTCLVLEPAIAESRTWLGVTVSTGFVIVTVKSALAPLPKAVHGPRRPVWSVTRTCQRYPAAFVSPLTV